jgi:DNA-binding IclR family transcriptional regulator
MRTSKRSDPSPVPVSWTFLSNHAHVLVCLARDPEMRLRDVAVKVGITERAVQKILVDLESAQVVSRTRQGRRNRYSLHPDHPLRHPVESHRTIRNLLQALLTPAELQAIPRE